MPYYRRRGRFRRRTYRRRRSYRKRMYTTRRLASAALRRARSNRSLISGDRKWADSLQQRSSCSYIGTPIAIFQAVNGGNGIVQGDGQANRIGTTIRMTRLVIEGQVSMDPTDTNPVGTVRIMVFGFTTPINASSVLDNCLAETGSASDVFSMLRMDPAVPYTRFYDRVHELSPSSWVNTAGATSGIAAGRKAEVRYRVNVGWRNGMELKYAGPGVTSPSNYFLYLVVVSDRTPGVGIMIPFSYNVRMKWYG